MSETEAKRSALSLLSGGLDSQLAIAVLKAQGIGVHAVTFASPFSETDAAQRAARNLGVTLHVVDFTAEIIGLVEHPRHGFGACMNPCIDCHALMLRRAGELAASAGIDFLSTGEVLDQRPMSQNRRSLDIVSAESGYADLIVRPLSARLLPATKPLREGWVDPARLPELHGRSRKPQMALAREYGVREYPMPAGGCRLTEPNYSRRLRDLKEHEGLGDPEAIRLLRIGRHFRLRSGARLIVGRDEKDNLALDAARALASVTFQVTDGPGPTAVIRGAPGPDDAAQAAAICARYADSARSGVVRLRVRTGEREWPLETAPATDAECRSARVG